jgi:hypothetical protein
MPERDPRDDPDWRHRESARWTPKSPVKKIGGQND